MRTTRVLAIVAILGIAFSFRASANVAYDSETTNEWFKVEAANPGDFSGAPWTKPTYGEVSVVDSKIALDTDLDDPLIYAPTTGATGPVVIVTAQYTATANAATPDLTDTPQAALAVIANGADTNWYGLVMKNSSTSWEKFTNVIPTVGETYTIHIDLDNVTHKIRYWVGGTILGGGWYDNPKSANETQVTSVSFVGTGDIGNFGGDNITENGATFNGTGYATFADALAAAKASGAWADGNPIVLYKNAEYTASETETLYVNPNGKTFTISGEVVTKTSGNTYTVTAQTDCEAKIGSTYYVTFDEAVTAAGASDVIVVNKEITKDLTVAKSYSLNPNGKLMCATLTVNADQTLTLAGGLAVTTATINGAVAGETLTVNGALTGVNVAKLTFGNAATFAYAGTPLAVATLGTTLRITGLSQRAVGTTVIASGVTGSTTFTSDLPTGRCLEASDGALKVASVIEIDDLENVAGYDYTNGTVNVEATLKSGTGTAVLTVVDFLTGGKTTYEKALEVGENELSWDLTDLTQGGAYIYTVDVKVGGTTVATKSGEFTAAKWGADGAWFIADATTTPATVGGGEWEAIPEITDGKYAVSDSKFNVMSETGSNEFTRVDTRVAFESLVDGEPDAPEGDAIGGFVATAQGWMALGTSGWIALSGGAAPMANVEYVIRAELDFPGKRVRFFVNDGAGFVVLSDTTGGEWVAWTKEQQTLKAVEFQGSGALASINATVADKALAVVDGVEYDDMDKALAAAKQKGKAIELLTNATIEPKKEGKYEIAPGTYQYVSGGKISGDNRTIIVDKSGEPPVVRPTDAEMQKVMTPDGKPYENYDSLRKFLEKNKVAGYTNDTADAVSVSNALMMTAENTLLLWQDYALGIDKNTSVAPVTTPAGDTNPNAITLAIPTIDTSKYSHDYIIRYQVMKGSEPVPSEEEDKNPGAILIPLTSGTGTYTIKAVFTAE